jgi:hypothetical protein
MKEEKNCLLNGSRGMSWGTEENHENLWQDSQ